MKKKKSLKNLQAKKLQKLSKTDILQLKGGGRWQIING